MHKYFLVKVKYEKTSEEGKIVKVSELYLVDALSFTECEARIVKEMEPFISGEFEVAAITKKNYTEIVENELAGFDKWFECKLNFITLDEEKGVEKKTPVFILVQSDFVGTANDMIESHMKDSVADYTIEGVKETKIIDVFNH
jgi:hypothetical protein